MFPGNPIVVTASQNHFQTLDYIRWNHDLRAIEKMIKLLSKDGKIIITVPAGQPILS